MLEWILFFVIAFIAVAGVAFLCLIKSLPVRIMCISLLVSICLLVLGLIFYWQLQSSGFFILYIILSLIATAGAVLLQLIRKVNIRIIFTVLLFLILFILFAIVFRGTVIPTFKQGGWQTTTPNATQRVTPEPEVSKIVLPEVIPVFPEIKEIGPNESETVNCIQNYELLIEEFFVETSIPGFGYWWKTADVYQDSGYLVVEAIFYYQSLDPTGDGAVWAIEITFYITIENERCVIGRYEDSEPREASPKESARTPETICIAAGYYHTVGLKPDGAVVATGDNEYGQCDVSGWRDIVAVSAGRYHTAGLKSDGSVVAVGTNAAEQCDVSGWSDIIAIAARGFKTVGLKSDGTVVAVGRKIEGQCDVSGWSDIVAISAGYYHTVGLKSDGTVVAVGNNYEGQCDVEDWKDIIKVSAGACYTIGVKSDGTVVAIGDNETGQCDVEDWSDIVAVSAGYSLTVGLKSDGTVVATGSNRSGQCNVEDWRDIIKVSAGGYYTIGVKSDGTVVAVGENGSGQSDVDDWINICLETEEEPKPEPKPDPKPEPDPDDCSDVYSEVIDDYFASGSFYYTEWDNFEIYDSGWGGNHYIVYVRVFYDREDSGVDIEEYEFILENSNGECYVSEAWLIDYWTKWPEEPESVDCSENFRPLIDDWVDGYHEYVYDWYVVDTYIDDEGYFVVEAALDLGMYGEAVTFYFLESNGECVLMVAVLYD